MHSYSYPPPRRADVSLSRLSLRSEPSRVSIYRSSPPLQLTILSRDKEDESTRERQAELGAALSIAGVMDSQKATDLHRNGGGGGDNGHGDDGDVAEWKQVAELRAVVEAQDPACKEEDDFMLRRFLRARDHNVGKAAAMLLKYLKWKPAAKPRGFISDEEVAYELAQDKAYLQGFDKLGRPMVYAFGAKHYAAKRDLEQIKQYVIYVLDKTVARLPRGQEKFAAVVDLKGWGYSNCDIRGYLAGLDIMQSYYPERLGRVFLIHVPYIFMAAWKIVYPFIDDNTKKKFVFVSDKELDKTLREAIDESQLPEMYGGKLKLVSETKLIKERPGVRR